MTAVPSPIIVSGTGGFLGSTVVRLAAARGLETIAVKSGDSSPELSLKALEDRATIESLRARGCHAWIHCGWWGVSGQDRNDPRQLTVNIPATLQTILFAHQIGCNHWLGVGSQAEFGPRSGSVSESEDKRPSSLYGLAKVIAAEQSKLLTASLGLKWSWLRVFSLYGPGDAPYWLIPTVIRQLGRDAPPELTHGEQLWDYLYIDDAAAAVLEVIRHGSSGDFNIGSGKTIKIRELVERVRSLMESEVPLYFGSVPYRPDQVMHLQANISKICGETGWAPRVPLDEGLVRTISYFKDKA